MRVLAAFACLSILATGFAGCLAPGAVNEPTAPTDGEAPDFTGPYAVVAFVDTGINPYHVVFRDESPRAYAHPSTYLPDYPEDAVALNVTFGHETIEDALKADCEEWEKVEADKLYWFPGTRIVGAIYVTPTSMQGTIFEGSPRRITCDDPRPGMIYGTSGHGTMVASRGAGNDYGACRACLIVAVHGFSAESTLWPADQPWIDAQSNSWGPVAPAWTPMRTPAGLVVSDPDFVRAVEDAASRQPSFWASGNGAAFRGGVLGHPTQLGPHFGPSAIRVGGHDSGRVALWPGSSPHVVSDACWSWAAEHGTMDESTPRTGGGTSGATPFVAGLAGRVILEARTILGDHRTGVREGGVLAQGEAGVVAAGPLADGDLTIKELRDLIFKTADPRPERIEEDGDVCEPTAEPFYALYWGLPVEWRQVPEGPQAIPLLGYGAVTPATVDLVVEILLGEAELPARLPEGAFFEQDDAYRRESHKVFSGS